MSLRPSWCHTGDTADTALGDLSTCRLVHVAFPHTHTLCIFLSSPGFHGLPLPAGDAAECGDDDAEGGAGPAARRCRGQGGERAAAAGHQGPRRGHRQVSGTSSHSQARALVQCHGRGCLCSGFLLLSTAAGTKGCLGFGNAARSLGAG